MTIKENAFAYDDTALKAWQIASLVSAISEAIYHGVFDVSSYEGAFYALIILANEVQDEVRTLTDGLFDALRNEDKKEG